MPEPRPAGNLDAYLVVVDSFAEVWVDFEAAVAWVPLKMLEESCVDCIDLDQDHHLAQTRVGTAAACHYGRVAAVHSPGPDD